MNIKEKLEFIEHISQPKIQPTQKSTTNFAIENVIDGEIISSEFGQTFVRTIIQSLDTNHGAVSISEIDEIDPHFLKLAGKDENLCRLNLRRALFFDTETTGLAGGSGTYIFLAGVGYFEENQFIIKQFFLRDFPEEFVLLNELNELMKRFEGFVSFNGKSYDVPLLKDRFVIHQIKAKISHYPHLDLLHAARRVWKNRLPDCSLGSLERNIMNFQRNSDVPSYLIPQLYFEYLRNKDARPLEKVFYHNKIDILSLVSLTILLHHIHKAPFDLLKQKTDLLTLAKHYDNINQFQQHIFILENLIKSETNPIQKKALGIQLAFCYKRAGQIGQAVNLWHELIKAGNFRLEPYVELAKYYEHQVNDLRAAWQIIDAALKNLDLIEQLGTNDCLHQQRADLLHRQRRIKNKLAR